MELDEMGLALGCVHTSVRGEKTQNISHFRRPGFKKIPVERTVYWHRLSILEYTICMQMALPQGRGEKDRGGDGQAQAQPLMALQLFAIEPDSQKSRQGNVALADRGYDGDRRGEGGVGEEYPGAVVHDAR